MKWLQHLSAFLERRNLAVEKTADLTGNYTGWGDTRGRIISARTAENVSAVMSCVNIIASSIASLPVLVYRRTPQGRVEDPEHPLAALVRNGPNPHQSWPDFTEWLTASMLLRGNGLAEIESDAGGRVTALYPRPWEHVSVQQLRSGRLAYDIVETVGLYGATGLPRRRLEGEVLHLRDRSDDGLVGRSRLARAAAVFNVALHVQDAAGSVYENTMRPAGVVSTQSLSGVGKGDDLKRQIGDGFSGVKNWGKTLMLGPGMKWEPMSVTPEDAELLANRRFTVEEICRLYSVPPPLAQDYSKNTFTNAETAGRWFAQFTIAPMIRKIEAEFSRSVFSAADRDTHEMEIDLSGFMRGDYAARWNAHKIAVDGKILSINEVRGVEGWNPRPGGDFEKRKTEETAP